MNLKGKWDKKAKIKRLIIVAIASFSIAAVLILTSNSGRNENGIIFSNNNCNADPVKINLDLKLDNMDDLGDVIERNVENLVENYESQGSYKYNQSVNIVKTLSIEDIKNINIDSSCFDIKVEPTDDKNLSIKLAGNILSDKKFKKPDLSISKSLGKIEVKTEHNQKIFGRVNQKVILFIGVPKAYKHNLKIDSSVSDVTVDNIVLDTLNVNSATGDATISASSFKNGDFNISVGDMEIIACKGAMTVDSSTGDVDIEVDELVGDIDARSSLGDINLILPKESSFDYALDTNLGDIDSNVPGNKTEKVTSERREGKYGNGGIDVNVKVSTGDVNFKVD